MITIIAEKPSVAQAIARIVHSDTRKDGYYEGSRYYVTWAFGHMVEIYAEGADSWDADLPLIPDSFSLRVARTHTAKGDRADPGYAKQLGVIRSLAARSEAVINAGDAGREGELIQRYIYAYIGLRKPVRRLWISSLTDSAIRKGLEELRPSRDYDALYEAGRARSEADWLVGINATRALTRASGGKRVLSLGRVQTPTLGIVCRRFLENRDFVPSPFWTLKAEARLGKAVFTARSPRFGDRREALCAIEPALSAPGMIVETVERTTKEVQPPLLHDLTSLQKACNQRYGMTADETLSAAQSLYEKKLITYPRTVVRSGTVEPKERERWQGERSPCYHPDGREALRRPGRGTGARLRRGPTALPGVPLAPLRRARDHGLLPGGRRDFHREGAGGADPGLEGRARGRRAPGG